MSEDRLSPQQRWLWLHGAEARAYSAQLAYAVEGKLDRSRLERAAARVAARHEALRTTFERPVWSKVPMRRVDGAAEARVAETAEVDEGAPEAILAARRAGVFDLGRGPLLALTPVAAPAGPLLLIEAPALAADRRTLELVAEELGRFWEPGTDTAADDEEPLQYGDYVTWQNELVSEPDEAGNEARARWVRHDAARRGGRLLPEETESPGLEGFAPEVLAVPLTPDLRRALLRLAPVVGGLPALLQAAFEALLRHRLGEAPLVGRVFDGRRFADLEGGMGPFARTLPAAGGARPEAGLAELARSVAAVAVEAEGRQEYGWGELGEPGDGPRFAYVYEHAERRRVRLARGLTLSPAASFVCAEPFTLRLSTWEGEEDLGAELAYDSARLPAVAARRLAVELVTLLGRGAEAPDTALGELSPLTPADRHRLLRELDDAPEAPRAEGGIVACIAAHARRDPGAPALTADDASLTYGELADRAFRLAHRLREAGAGPERAVAVFAERSAAAVVGMVAALASGGAYLPLDPALPAERLAAMLEDVRPAVILAAPDLADRLPAGTATVLSLDAALSSEPASGEAPVPPETDPAPESLAYLLFTSGSTGRPKGVAVEHRQLVAYVDAVVERLAPPPGSSFALISTLAADLGNTMLWPALATGGRLEVVGLETAGSPPELARLFRERPADYLKIVPSHLAVLASGSEAEELAPRRCLVLGGEAAPRDLARRFARVGTAVLNHYGPTETTVGVLTGPAGPADLEGEPGSRESSQRGRALPLGRPLSGNRVQVVDRKLRPTASGAAGELVVGGAQVTRGYYGRPAATAERFVPDPFADAPGGRLYRTGDRARRLLDGRFYFLGRVDRQLKIHGFRVEPGEIEAALEAHPDVAQAAVTAREDAPGEPRLAAYVVPASGRAPSTSELAAFLAARLPGHMVPSAFVSLPALPVTPNGKLDRAALPAPDEAPAVQREYLPPRNEVEAALAEIWQRVLSVDRVGMNDNFFEMGGDSILVIQVVAQAHQARLRLRPGDLFQHQTVADLAAVVEVGEGPATDASLPEGPLPLTPIQAWFFERELEDETHWNQALLLAADGAVDADRLAAALAVVARHHDAFRLRFPAAETEGETGRRQLYAPLDSPSGPAGSSLVGDPAVELFPLVREDFAALPDDRVAAAVEAAAGEVQRSFDPSAGPLAGAALFDLGPARPARLFLAVHHLAVDAVSWRILLADLTAVYRDLGAGRAPELPPPSTPYGRWARRLAEETAAGRFDDQLGTWRRLLASAAEAAPLPLDRPGDEGTEASARRVESRLGADDTAYLLGGAHDAYRTEVPDFLLTALASALTGWTGAAVAAVELEGHGREPLAPDVDVSRTVGWFTSRFPVVLRPGDPGDPGASLTAVKEQLRAVPERGFGFGALRYLRGGTVSAELAVHRPPEVSFNYLGQLDRGLSVSEGGAESRAESGGAGERTGGGGAGPAFRPADEPTGPAHAPGARRGHRLSVTARVAGGHLTTGWSYSADTHDASTIEALAATFTARLQGLLAHCREAEAGGFTPSDFGLVDLDQGQLDDIAARIKLAKG